VNYNGPPVRQVIAYSLNPMHDDYRPYYSFFINILKSVECYHISHSDYIEATFKNGVIV
jgi:hypothetical protein